MTITLYERRKTMKTMQRFQGKKWCELFILAGLCIIVWTAGEAFAANGPCDADYQKFCASITPGGGRIAKCMKDHENDLSNACKNRMIEAKERYQGIQEACHDDVDKLCSGIRSFGGHILKCLKNHKYELSQECKSKLKWGPE
jgi:hypothetical protein